MGYTYWRKRIPVGNGTVNIKVERDEDRDDGATVDIAEFLDFGLRYCDKPIPVGLETPDHVYRVTVEEYKVGASENRAIVLAYNGEKFHLANPEEWKFYDRAYARMHGNEAGLFLMRFGQISCTQVAVWADGFESALEEAAGYIKDRGWEGLFSEPDYKDAREDLGPDASEEAVQEHAETDHTYTESGWLYSEEWTGHEAPEDLQKACELIGQILESEEETNG